MGDLLTWDGILASSAVWQGVEDRPLVAHHQRVLKLSNLTFVLDQDI
jgi:hypothetical protein